MIAVVLSNQHQLTAFQKAHLTPAPTRVYCDNECFYADLQRNGIEYQPLNEFQLRSEWSDINTWGCRTASQWIRTSREGGFFKTLDFASAFYLFFSHLLVQGLKNLAYANKILGDSAIKRIVVFKGSSPGPFPKFSGNSYLNYFLGVLGQAKKLDVLELFVGESLPAVRSQSTNSISIHARNVLEQLYSACVRIPPKPLLWVYGSLMHLKTLLLELKKQKIPFFYYNSELNLDQLKFSLFHGIPYYVARSFPKATQTAEDFPARKAQEIKDALDYASQKGLFLYRDFDMSDFVKSQIFGQVEEALVGWLPVFKNYENTLAQVQVTAFLTDEDYALRGGLLTAFLKSRNIPSYCISHANTAVDFNIPPGDGEFRQSTTFVHSQSEIENYIARGWKPDGFVLTGTPRYDVLARISRKPQSERRKLRLLYCTNTSVTEKHSPNNYGYLGHAVYSTESVTRPAAEAILNAIKGSPVELWLKPHNTENIGEWEAFVAQRGCAGQVKLLRRKATIMEYFPDCDAMILSYWSSALIEAGLAKLPVIFVDANDLQRPSVINFAKHGLCHIVKNTEELRHLLDQACVDRSFLATLRILKDADYYLGTQDGLASTRIADHVRSTVSSSKMEVK